MTPTLKKYREDRTLAHVLPLMWFVILTMILSFVAEAVELNNPSQPWFIRWPETWVLGIVMTTTAIILAFFWKHYEFRWNTKAVLIGAVMGAVGIGFWLLPTSIHDWMGLKENADSGWMKWLGIHDRERGLDPNDFNNQAGMTTWLIIRFFRAVVIVSLVEEIFWRSFLMRFLLKPDGNYWKVPFGKPSWKTFGIVTVAFALAHAPVDYAGALVYGSLTYLVAIWTKSLLACVVMHGVANFLMCWFALETGKWGLL